MIKVKFKFKAAIASTTLLTLLLSGLLPPNQLSLLTANLSANANTSGGYVPPTDREPIQRTDGAGSRGCPQGSFGSISLLIPKDHVGLTVSDRPTFSWYVSALPSTPMQFALVEPGVAQPILVKQLRVNKTGIVQLKLPTNISGLSVGKTYRWTVSLVCNAKRPSVNIYVRSWIARVPNHVDELQLLATASSQAVRESTADRLRQRAIAYAQSGIWYDAIATISKAYLANPQDRLNIEYLHLLLTQVGLSQVPILETQPFADLEE
ncbi:MAG TPA: hypothetical protein DCY88_20175 [Cyanobacteria bacterium UBA11372]|nr:hypothetical protein [Cyanobacteria bacterium UBA11372]